MEKRDNFFFRDERDKIRMLLYRNSLTNFWLVNRLEKKGIVTEKTELSSVLRGVRRENKCRYLN